MNLSRKIRETILKRGRLAGGEKVDFDRETLECLKSLGYIQD